MKMQAGYLTKKSGSWLAHYSKWLVDPATGIKRRRQMAEKIGPVSGMTRTKAKTELQKIVVKQLGLTGDSRMTVSSFITHRWQPLREGTWRESTKSTNEELLKIVTDRFGGDALEDVDSVALQTWLNSIAKTRSGSAVRHCRIFLRSIFAEAVIQKRIEMDPARLLKVPKLRAVLRPYLDMTEVRALLTASMPFGMITRDTCLLRLLLTTGLRPSELFALRWKCIDLEQGTLSVAETVYRGKVRAFGKTTEEGEVARLALPPEAVMALQQQWEIAQYGEYGDPDDFVFPNVDGGFVLKENYQQRVLAPLVKQAKIKKVVNYQVLRRTCMTHLMQHGTLKDVQSVARHKRAQTTIDNYVQEIAESTRAAGAALSRVMCGPAKAPTKATQ